MKPLGLMKNKLAAPFARIIPSMFEIEPPVTGLKMFSMVEALLKKASQFVGKDNSLKLWNKLLPLLVPPSINKKFT